MISEIAFGNVIGKRPLGKNGEALLSPFIGTVAYLVATRSHVFTYPARKKKAHHWCAFKYDNSANYGVVLVLVPVAPPGEVVVSVLVLVLLGAVLVSVPVAPLGAVVVVVSVDVVALGPVAVAVLVV